MNYKDAGVDIDAGNKFVQDLKKKVPYLEDGFGGKMKIFSFSRLAICANGAFMKATNGVLPSKYLDL